MTLYSHSKLSTFEQCRQKYKFQYIDRIQIDVPDTVESFMGRMVHETLEKLYSELTANKTLSKEELIRYYNRLWEDKWTDNILIVKKEFSKEYYAKKGSGYIERYYESHKPFNNTQTIGLETSDILSLDGNNDYSIKIDRLSKDSDGTYYVYDYKTTSRMKNQQELDEDRQLAMYSLWVKNNFSDVNDVKLVWNFLAFNKEVVSRRTEKQLEILKSEIKEKIKSIESCTDFPPKVSMLCDWCKFKPICPSWQGIYDIPKKPAREKQESLFRY
ncbi:MAG: PD-(D/E)XK nuclease family protein [Nanoarchaeota archaeon]|nr:PD-(D/E)XK nuclease family protein [Nanoarchaeota archaeon]